MIDGNGNIIPVNAIRGEKGKDGVNGKSAYEQAKEGGYDGTEEEFIATLNGLTAGEHAEHYANLDNPHQVTAQQVGALPITGGQLQGGLGLVGEGDANTSEIVQNSDFATIFRNKAGGIATILSLTNESKVDVADVLKLWFANGTGYSIYGEHNKPTASEVGAIPETYYVSGNLDIELQQGGGKMVVCCYTENTQNTPHKEGLTDCTHGMVITNAFNSQYATQLSIPSGEDAIYVRRLNGSGVSKWVKMADNDRIIPIDKGGTGATTAEEALRNLGIVRAIMTCEMPDSSASRIFSYPSGFNKDNTCVVSFMGIRSDGGGSDYGSSAHTLILNDNGIRFSSTNYIGKARLILERHDI